MASLASLNWPAKWHYAYSKPTQQAQFKSQYRDFCVFENLGFTPGGVGEHVFLDITKTNTNTEFLSRQIAQLAKVPKKHVAYSGMKDRHAITRQWFAVHLPGNTAENSPDWYQLNSQKIQLHQVIQHQKKLRLGVHQSNDFVITLRNLSPNAETEQRLLSIQAHGVPNYFGEQRFGINGNNLLLAQAFCQGQKQADRFKRSLAISVARAYLFNTLLSAQVADNSWLRAGAIGYYGFTDGYSQFASSLDTDLQQRIDDGHISPLGWLAGKIGKGLSSQCLDHEQKTLQNHQDWIDALSQKGVVADRRALRLLPLNFQWQWLPTGMLELRFRLLRGGYATSVLRELVDYTLVDCSTAV